MRKSAKPSNSKSIASAGAAENTRARTPSAFPALLGSMVDRSRRKGQFDLHCRAVVHRDRLPRAHSLSWNPYGDDGSCVHFAVDLQLPAVEFDKDFRQRQAETDAVIFARQAAVHLPKGRQREFDLVGGNADPGVLDTELQIATRIQADRQGHRT